VYIMYVDESGDSGLQGSPTQYFVLCGLVVHELRWQSTLDRMVAFRREMKDRFGLRLRDELHAAHFISRPGELVRIPRNDRLTIVRHFADCLGSMADLNLLAVIVDKTTASAASGGADAPDVFGRAWSALLQRFENTLAHRNFSGPANPDDRGMLFPDHTDDLKLTSLLRRMRRYNPIPNDGRFGGGFRDLPVGHIIEDPHLKDSATSYFIQAADLAAYLVYQSLAPNAYMKRKTGHTYYRRLEPICCKVASRSDPMGFVRLRA